MMIRKIKYLFSLIGLCFSPFLFSQTTLEIHHIDVGTGDAALINVLNDGANISHSILIDAGKKCRANNILEFLQDFAKKNGKYVHLDYVISSHYHEDHIGGMVGSRTTNYRPGNGPGKRRKCGYTYPGLLGDTSQVKYFALLDKGDSAPSAKSDIYGDYVDASGARRITVGATTVGNAGAVDSIVPSAVFPPPMPNAGQQALSLGGYIDLGEDINGVPIRLRLVVADAYVYAPGDPFNTYNVADTLGIIRGYKSTDDLKARSNPNNWGVGWVLEYGAFRYYTAGDLGGYDKDYGTCTSCSSNYFDIETPLADNLPLIYPQPPTSPGHICTQKASHHGSCCSTNTYFWETLRPSFAVVSAGGAAKFGHPTQEVVDRIQDTKWKADSLNNSSVERYLLTELHFGNREIDLKKGATSGNVFVVATDQYVNPVHVQDSVQMKNGQYLYTTNNSLMTYKGDILIEVDPVAADGTSISSKSSYRLEYASYDGHFIYQTVNCHTE